MAARLNAPMRLARVIARAFLRRPAFLGIRRTGDEVTVGITLEQAQAQLAAWLLASSSVASKQSYSINTGNGQRTLTLAKSKSRLFPGYALIERR